jgi:hypothetical protein
MNVDDLALDQLAAKVGRLLAPAYAAGEWEWRDEGVPDAAMLASQTRGMLERVKPEGALSCGGIQVSRFIEDDEERFTVEFAVGSVEAALSPSDDPRSEG